MIPSRLSMRNFMCYRDNVPPLYFNGIHLACLSGGNGNGKSAIIDAMTWALWGKARTNSADDLIHSTQTEMEIEFDFAVGEQLYRVIRKRSKAREAKGVGQSVLDLQRASNGDFKSESGNSIDQTQKRIIDILHMDYDTFINSAYLRQGHADEFTIKRPAERKEVLGYILGLSHYEELETRAREMAKQQESEKGQMERDIRVIQDELAQKPAYEAELERVKMELLRVEETFSAQESELKGLRQQKEVLEQKIIQLRQMESHIADIESNLHHWEEQVKQHQSRITEYEELIARRSDIDGGYTRLAEAKRLYDELDGKFRISVNLERQKSQLESAVQKAVYALNTEHALTQKEILRLETRSKELAGFKNQLQQIQSQLRYLDEQEEILTGKKQELRNLQSQASNLESSKNHLEQEIKEIKEIIALLANQSEAKCPLCETELGTEGIRLIESKYITDRQNKNESLLSRQGELSLKISAVQSLQNELLQSDAKLNQERITGQRNAGVLENNIAEAEDAVKQLSEQKYMLAEIEQRLASKDFVIAEQAALGELEKELANLAYDAARHEQVRQSLDELKQYELSKHRLDEADTHVTQEKEDIARAMEVALKLQQNMEDDRQKRQHMSEELASLPELLSKLAQSETENQELTGQRNQVQETVGRVKTRLERLADLEIKRKEYEALTAQSARKESIYRELAKAFGKGGIQAMLIETALPEIEVEANRLLSRMTDNRMHLQFVPQKETKKGSVIETLDINISDELGTRNYEMFSGGEAFRINFAVRIALSRLLVKRAGAPLPTLIIDEGFGTQDNAGIEKLKEAISSIQDDFDKILVITHIEELRDSFPTHIDVVKDAEGSTISVN
ncbi:AAA family ATPase [Chloroflexota bacterium]